MAHENKMVKPPKKDKKGDSPLFPGVNGKGDSPLFDELFHVFSTRHLNHFFISILSQL
jgi:hypothetical protein